MDAKKHLIVLHVKDAEKLIVNGKGLVVSWDSEVKIVVQDSKMHLDMQFPLISVGSCFQLINFLGFAFLSTDSAHT